MPLNETLAWLRTAAAAATWGRTDLVYDSAVRAAPRSKGLHATHGAGQPTLQQPATADVIVRLRDARVSLRFDGRVQALRLIEVADLNALVLTYQGAELG
jgi:hypothetical protein